MRVIRLLSLAGGVFGILLPAALLASTAHGIPDWIEPYIVLVGVALGSGGFFLVAMASHRMNRDAMLRSFAALLLMMPFGASGIVIWHASNMLMVWLCTFLLMLTILLTHVPQQPIVPRTPSRRAPKPMQWVPLRRSGQRERRFTQPS